MNFDDVVVKQENIELDFAIYQEAIKLNPQDASAYNKLGSVYFSRGEYESASIAYKNAIELVPNNADTHNSLGVAY